MSSPSERLIIDLNRLLTRCEEILKGSKHIEDWKLPKFLQTAQDLLNDLQTLSNKREFVNEIDDFRRRLEFLNSVVEAKNKGVVPKNVEIRKHCDGIGEEQETIIQQLKQIVANQQENFVREELLTTPEKQETTLRQRKQMSEPTGSNELDSLISDHRSKQEKIAEDMLHVTRSIKEQAQLAGKIIRKDTQVVEKSSTLIDRSQGSLQKHSDRLQFFISNSSWQCWIWLLVIAVVVIFLNMIFFMKIAKKRLPSS